MKIHSRLLLVFLMSFLVFLIGCAPETGNELNADALESTAAEIVRQTASVPPTVPPLNTPTAYEIKSSNTPTVTPTEVIATPSATVPVTTPTTEQPEIIMTGDTNCREGPSTHYGFVTLLLTGQTANVVGRDRDGYYWVVENPNGEGQCWVWNAYATPSGPISRVPILNAPSTKTPTRMPTITPRALASIRYFKTISCDGQDAIVIRIYNYSRRDLNSWRAQIFDYPGKIRQVVEVSDFFSHSDTECRQTLNIINYRTDGYAIIRFDEDSAVKYLIEFEVCTGPGKLGDCLFYGFYLNNPNITPTPTPTNTPTPTPSETP